MWKKIRPMLPHAGILLGNVMVVLFTLEQINPTMNFIDNGLTKGLLVLMTLAAALIWRERRRAKARKARKRDATRSMAAAATGLCGACVVLIPLDGIFPAWNLFLKPPVQWLIALGAVALIAAGSALASRDRRLLRRERRRQRG